MKKKKILFYTSDGVSLGHLKRISLIAKSLKEEEKGIKINLVTSSLNPSIFGNFFDECIQIVPLSDKLLEDPFEEARLTNTDLVLSFFKKFKPDLVVADFLLASRFTFYPLKNALDNFPTKSVFIWRVGEIKKIANDLKKEKEKLNYFDKVFLPYGMEEMCKHEKLLPHNFEVIGPIFGEINKNKIGDCLKKYKISSKDFLITIVLGGGGELREGNCESPCKIVEEFLGTFNKLKGKISNLKVVMCIGPYYKKDIDKDDLKKKKIVMVDFEKNMLELISASGLIVSPAGYNICQEIITAKTPAVLVPLWRKNKEQFERARYLERRGIVKVLGENSKNSLVELLRKSYDRLSDMKNKFSNFSDLNSGNKKIAQKILKILD